MASSSYLREVYKGAIRLKVAFKSQEWFCLLPGGRRGEGTEPFVVRVGLSIVYLHLSPSKQVLGRLVNVSLRGGRIWV